MPAKPRLAVYKFASCDGCQLTLLALEDQLLDLGDRVELSYFLEASSRLEPGPYDVALVEGSVTTPHDAERIRQVRRDARYLVTIGACATAGGIQALRNFADHADWMAAVYARPDYIQTLRHSTPIAAHVPVDFELRGCPVSKQQLLEVLVSLLAGRKPKTPAHSVCLDCKRRGTVCTMVATGTPCLGPITHSGCGICARRTTAGVTVVSVRPRSRIASACRRNSSARGCHRPRRPTCCAASMPPLRSFRPRPSG